MLFATILKYIYMDKEKCFNVFITFSTWVYYFSETMKAFFNVRDCQKSSADVTGTQVVHYYIAAREIFWDYAPSGIDFFSGNSLTEAGR